MKLPEELKEKLKEKLEELFTKYKNIELKNAYSNISDKYRHGARN